jgi:Family of unknown function (DUF6477)
MQRSAHGKRGRPGVQRRRAACDRLARDAISRTVKAGAGAYDRARDLPALIRLDPFARLVDNAESLVGIVARLERALRAERNRARSGHWTYDLNRHIALRQAFVAESERLAAMSAGRVDAPGRP